MMKKMKTKTLLFLSTLFLIACGGGEELSGDIAVLKGQKDSLRQLKNQIAEEIRSIEDKLKLLDSNGNHNVPVVTIEEVQKDIFRHYFTVQGVVETDLNATVNAEVGAKVQKILVSEGQQVRKGQLMLELDRQVLENSIAELKTQIELAQTVYKKQKNLWDQKIGSEIQYLEAKTNRDALEQKLKTLYAQMEFYMITAPFDGVVDEIFPKIGEMAAPGIPLVRVVNVNKVYIKADVSENYLGKIKEGDTSYIHVPGAGKEFKSTIQRIGSFINPNNRTIKIRFDLDNKDQTLLPNMLSTVDILDYKSEDKKVIVPNNLIQQTPAGEHFMFIVHENGSPRAQKVMIEIGRTYKGRSEILSGLSEGDKIIVRGGRGIKDGEIIEVIAE